VSSFPFRHPSNSRVWAEAVAGGVHGVVRLAVVTSVVRRLGEVGEVGHNELHRRRDGIEDVALQDVHAVGDAVALGVLPGELDGVRVCVSRPDLDLPCVDRERDCDGARAGADVRDAHRHAVDAVERRVDEPLGRGARREDTSGRSEQLEAVEGGFHKLPQWRIGRPMQAGRKHGTGMVRVVFPM
jgi:hypothetical protein